MPKQPDRFVNPRTNAANVLYSGMTFLIAYLQLTRGHAEERMRIKAALKLAESQGRTSWEEPSLFPQLSSQRASYNVETQKIRSPDVNNASGLSTPSEEASQSELKPNAGAFHTEFGSLGLNGTNTVGLESIRERDAILARIQGGDVTQPYNIKIGDVMLADVLRD